MNKKKVTDFEGNEFETVKDMCEYYELSYHTYLKRIKDGWDPKSALITRPNEYNTRRRN